MALYCYLKPLLPADTKLPDPHGPLSKAMPCMVTSDLTTVTAKLGS